MVSLVITIVLLIGSIGFGVWAYMGRQDYKNNVDEKIATAVEVAKQDEASRKDNEFLEREKQPLKDYKGPAAYGSITLKYPKTWSAYVNEAGRGSTPIEGYFHPGHVPGINDDNSYALRLEVSDRAYDEELKRFENGVRAGTVTVQAYASESAPDALGSRVEGEVVSKKQGAMILIPLRDKTLKVWTESAQFLKDFNEIILANLSFVP